MMFEKAGGGERIGDMSVSLLETGIVFGGWCGGEGGSEGVCVRERSWREGLMLNSFLSECYCSSSLAYVN